MYRTLFITLILLNLSLNGCSEATNEKYIPPSPKILPLILETKSNQTYWTEGNVNRPKGATDTYASKSNSIQWQNKMGDWLDGTGTQQGNKFISSKVISPNNDLIISLDVTTTVTQWLNQSIDNNGFYLHNKVKKNGRFRVRSHESEEATPKLEINTQKNKYLLDAVLDTTLSRASRHSAGHLSHLAFNKDSVNLLYFDLSTLTFNPSDVVSAKLILTKYGKHRGGEVTIEVYKVAPLPDEPSVEYGIAEQYHKDFGMLNNLKVLITEDFDNDYWLEKITHTRRHARYHIAKPEDTDNQYSPLIGDSLAIEFNPRQNLAFTGKYQLQELIGYEPLSLYFRYYIRLGDNWDSTLGGKFPGIAGTYNKAGWGGRKVNGTNGWSARGFFSTSVPNGEPFEGTTPLGNYVYHPDFNNRYGEGVMWGTARSSLVKNRWYCIEQHIKLNELGKKNGELNVWVDGILSYSRKNFRFRDVDSLKIESVWIDFYHGGTIKPKTVQEIYIDNIVIATEYIGPIRALY
ncbi:polysaccharide lyase [Candidatus Colwellia aromaticivorans]|uniref:polysaccharide lyase n=1 Tax=Candidatus Colwellia aromaticivorans TaxID=2267621 RepID=UPI000DF2BD09|nr:DNRLRE domain-containing protein [Candidatus Colwellia aromaticivorans]